MPTTWINGGPRLDLELGVHNMNECGAQKRPQTLMLKSSKKCGLDYASCGTFDAFNKNLNDTKSAKLLQGGFMTLSVVCRRFMQGFAGQAGEHEPRVGMCWVHHNMFRA